MGTNLLISAGHWNLQQSLSGFEQHAGPAVVTVCIHSFISFWLQVLGEPDESFQ